jgi:hypothetical protein
MIDLGFLLYNYEEKLSEFGVVDPNFSLSNSFYNLDGRELFKIFSRKYFLDSKSSLAIFMKKERELNFIRDQDILMTIAPDLIFKFINETYEIVKNTRIKQLLEFFLINFKEILLEYIIASDLIVNVIVF